jgi:predicted type IV restriction endonuclease
MYWGEGIMGALPSKAANRISAAIKKFRPILEAAKTRDVNESDTVVIVTDLLQELFGYDKYTEITSEHAIRGTYCDLAIKLGEKLVLLIEVKAIGTELKDQHVKQAIDYAANKPCDWVVLTNGLHWRVYKVLFAKPIDKNLVVDLCLTDLNPRTDNDVSLAGLLAKESWPKESLGEFLEQKEALSRYTIAAVLQTDPVLAVIKRELRRVSPKAKIEAEDVAAVLRNEVLKRDALEGEQADAAQKRVARAAKKTLRETKVEEEPPEAIPA